MKPRLDNPATSPTATEALPPAASGGSPANAEKDKRARGFRLAAAIVLALLGAAGLIALLWMPSPLLPAEDAVILYQYSRNLAETGIISFIPHGPRAEGATDFLYMVILSLGIKAGIPAYVLSCILSAASALGISSLLLGFAGVRRTALRLLSCTGILFFFPPMVAAAEGFSVLPFGLLLVAMVWYADAERMVETGILALLLCLLRPDGVVFAVPLLLFETLWSRERGRRLLIFAATFVVPGIVYFLWRWHYFGEFFPLPFLVKADAVRVGKIFVASSLRSIRGPIFFALALAAIACMGRFRERKNLRLLLCLIAVPALFYCSVRLDQNLALRFFFFLPLAAAIFAAQNWRAMARVRGRFLVAAVVLWAICLASPYKYAVAGLVGGQFRARMEIARDLGALSHRHTMLVTEAGVLPYYSRWIAYDAWGLNTPLFAHRLLEPQDVRRLAPDLIQIHLAPHDSSCEFDSRWPVPYRSRTWQHMTRNLIAGISPREYSLWRLPHGYDVSLRKMSITPARGAYECWYVRRADPDYERIVDALESHGAITQQAYRLLEFR